MPSGEDIVKDYITEFSRLQEWMIPVKDALPETYESMYRRYIELKVSLEVELPNTDWCNIAGKASDMHVEESLEVELPNTDRCNIAGKASDMHVEESLDVIHPNTDWCNIAGSACDMQE